MSELSDTVVAVHTTKKTHVGAFSSLDVLVVELELVRARGNQMKA